MDNQKYRATNPFPQRTDKMLPHQHQFVVPVEWRDTGFGPVVVTRLRCNGCPREVEREQGDVRPKETL